MINLGKTPLCANEHMMFGDPLVSQNVSALNLEQLLDGSQPICQVQDYVQNHCTTVPCPMFATNNFMGVGSCSGSPVIPLDNSESGSANVLNLNGIEIETKFLPEATVVEDQDNNNFMYSLILPETLRASEGWFVNPDDNENGFVNNNLSLSPLENIALINIGKNCESSSHYIHPTSLVDTTHSTSGILTEHSVSQNSDDTIEDCLSQDNGNEDANGEEKAVCIAGVFDNSSVVGIDHEEVIDLNNVSQINSKSGTLKNEPLINVSELVSEGRSHEDAYNDCQEAGTVVADPIQYFMHSVFTREEVTVVYDEVDGSQGHSQQVLVEEQQQLNYSTQSLNYEHEHEQVDLNFYHQENNHDNSSSTTTTTVDILERETDDPDWSLSNDDGDPPKKKHRRKSERSNKSNTKESRSNSKRRPKHGISKQGDSKPSGQGTTNKGRNHEDKNSFSIISQGTPVRSSGSVHCRTKIDMTSFRFIMGPHIRAVSAILEMTGMKYVSAHVPHDVIRRFHPSDVYRTIEKSIQSQTEWKANTTRDVEPDWQKMQRNIKPIDWALKFNGVRPEKTTNLDAGTLARIYYSSPFGFQNGSDCVISIRKEAEENGKLKDSPEVLTSIGSAELNVTLNLHIVAENCANTEFKEVGDDKIEVPLLIQLKRPQCIGILYKSGKIVVIGIKSYEEFRIAVRRLARMIQKIDENAMMRHEYLSKFISYDSSIFPGVVIKVNNSPILCMVFNSGAVLMTEAMGAAEMKSTLNKIYPTLRLFGYQS